MKKQENNFIHDEREMVNHGNQAINLHQNSVGHENDIRAPYAGQAPTVDHSASGKKESFSPRTSNRSLGFGDSVAVYKDDFRPTSSGSSPGVGHKYKDDIEPILRNVPGVTYSFAENSDDFRPTNPGGSPGAGHKCAEPNA
ncbi:precursor of CEP9-like [Cornus florida]|uniref:precursor of CEP9-like n=1 Tax=Cornus florida TaxID=4283 RepID=UPI0028969B7B|nr:precursor of CEP9-like [Cornus florida]